MVLLLVILLSLRKVKNVDESILQSMQENWWDRTIPISRNKVIQLNCASTGVDEIPMLNYSKSLKVTIEGLFLILRLIQKLIFA